MKQLTSESLNGMRITQTIFATAVDTPERDASPLERAFVVLRVVFLFNFQSFKTIYIITIFPHILFCLLFLFFFCCCFSLIYVKLLCLPLFKFAFLAFLYFFLFSLFLIMFISLFCFSCFIPLLTYGFVFVFQFMLLVRFVNN